MLVGGLGERVHDRVIAYGDGWFPILASRPEALGERIAELQRRAADAGRGRIPVTLFGTKPEAAFLERLRTAGVDRTLFLLPSDPPERSRLARRLRRGGDRISRRRLGAAGATSLHSGSGGRGASSRGLAQSGREQLDQHVDERLDVRSRSCAS